MPVGRLSGKCITWTAPACGRISTQLEQKGGGRSGAGPFPGRVREQNPSEGLGTGQAGGLGADPGSTARGQRVRGVDDPRVGEMLRAWPSPHQAPASLRRQRVRQPQVKAYLRRRGIRHTIPRKTDERRNGPFNRVLYRQRNLVEGTINRLKQFRRIAPGMRRRPRTIWQCSKSGRCYSGYGWQTRPSHQET